MPYNRIEVLILILETHLMSICEEGILGLFQLSIYLVSLFCPFICHVLHIPVIVILVLRNSNQSIVWVVCHGLICSYLG